MNNSVVNECLRQLVKVYIYAEEQYVTAASESTEPILRKFFEQRALERMDFVEEIYAIINTKRHPTNSRKTVDELYRWHRQLYGNNVLNRLAVTDIESLIIDEKAEEICKCLLKEKLPQKLEELLCKQFIRLEASILSMLYLKALHNS